MKKVLSVAMASAMVLGMGANAFAIQYNVESSDTAKWPENFRFAGSLFVTDKDGEVKESATTAITTDEDAKFNPGDVIWMPLYADNQKVYGLEGNKTEYDAHTGKAVTVAAIDGVTEKGKGVHVSYNDRSGVLVDNFYLSEGGVVFAHGYTAAEAFLQLDQDNLALQNGNKVTPIAQINHANAGDFFVQGSTNAPVKNTLTAVNKDASGNIKDYTIGGQVYGAAELTALKAIPENATLVSYLDTLIDAIGAASMGGSTPVKDGWAFYTMETVDTGSYTLRPGTKLVVTTNSFKAQKATDGKVVEVKGDGIVSEDEILNWVDDDDENVVDEYKDGQYTGNIDKDWSINLIEEKGKASELIEKAELYKATKKDANKYNIMPNAVYLKVSLKDEWKSVETVNLKYHVYVAENDTENKTNKVWVSGDYENALTKEVDFTWSNNANTPAVWEAKDTGVAVFDYNDKAFFTVKMYKGEKLYLDLKSAYDLATSNEIYDASGAEVESFYKFVTADANFSRIGELVLVSDDDTLVPYEVDEDGNLVEVEAEYVKDYKIAHTNEKVNGFKFETKELGNYILSEEIVVDEEEVEETPEEPAEETPAEPEAPVVPEEKPNPNTGAEDFVGLAVSLAVVSVAAAGALALKK